jgi:uncharacterized protein (TIGR02117 family)
MAVFLVRKPGDHALYPPPAGAAHVSVYLVDNGFHTGLALPTARLPRSGPLAQAVARSAGDAPYTEVGWGDAQFYIQTGVSPMRALDALRALFAPNNPSVIQVEGLRAAPDRLWSTGVARVDLSEDGFRRLTASIDRSFAVHDRRLVAMAGAPGFFLSVEHFSVLHLCNHWAAEQLNAAGLPIRPILDLLPAGLVFDLETDGVNVHRSARP